MLLYYQSKLRLVLNIKDCMQAPITNFRVDTCFANSLNAVRNGLIVHISLHLLQFLTMVIMIPIEIVIINPSGQEEVLSFFITASCITFINFVSKLSHLFCTLRDPFTCLSIATQLNHTVEQQPQQSERLDINENFVNNQIIVSQRVYNVQTNMTNQQASPEFRSRLQPALCNMIKTIALSRDPLARCTMNIGGFISFGLFIYGVIILSTVPMKVSQYVVMSLFLISEFIIQIQLFLCLIFIALLPLLCVLFCVFICCCRKQGHKQAKLPEAVPATVEIIQKTQGSSCSICFQDILLNQNVMVLPCSQKHVFHDKCIQAWTAVKPNCPMCRHDLSE